MTFIESTFEQAAIDWLKELGYDYAFDPEIAFGGSVRVMARLRDGMLLPRLMKSEIRVKDVESVL